MKTRIAAIIIVPIIGAILGYLFAGAVENQWFDHSWKMIEKPPIKVQRLVAVNSFSLWVQSDTGNLYYNADTVRCTSNCWKEVSAIPVLPIAEQNETVTDKACSVSPPLGGIIDRISQCRIVELNWGQHYNFTYALLNDGSIHLWTAFYYIGEGGPIITYTFFICLGGIAFFIFVLIIVLFLGMIDWLKNRATKKANESS